MNEGSQTEWSGAPLTNERIHEIRENIQVCAMNNDIKKYIMLLELLNHELYGFQTVTEQISIRNKITKLMDDVENHNKKRTFNNKPLPIPPKIMFELNDIYYTLDLVFHKSGLQTYIKEDAGDAF